MPLLCVSSGTTSTSLAASRWATMSNIYPGLEPLVFPRYPGRLVGPARFSSDCNLTHFIVLPVELCRWVEASFPVGRSREGGCGDLFFDCMNDCVSRMARAHRQLKSRYTFGQNVSCLDLQRSTERTNPSRVYRTLLAACVAP